MLRTQLHADPNGRYLHDLILESCRRFSGRIALVDTSLPEPRRITYGEYGDLIESLARGLVASGLQPGEVLAIFLPNSWEFCAVYHAATLAGAIPTPLNPSYREREVRYQLENSGAAMLVTDGSLIASMNLTGLPALRRTFFTRERGATSAEPLEPLFNPPSIPVPVLGPPQEVLAALPYSSGTTGLPKGVMLSHYNLVVNVFQILAAAPFSPEEVAIAFLPLYHIYGLNVVLNSVLALGGKLVLMPRFELNTALERIASEKVTFLPVVPPVLNTLTQAAERGAFPRQHHVRWAKSGAAPLAPELPRRFTELTGIRVVQGYGMTEASPVTHFGFLEGPLYRPESIGAPVAMTSYALVRNKPEGSASGAVADDHIGELVMQGPQFMLGYWKSPQATAEVLRPLPPDAVVPVSAASSKTSLKAKTAAATHTSGSDSSASTVTGNAQPWYFSGDIVRVDSDGLFHVVDRRKEMIKFKGFAIAPAEVEAVLLEHSAVRDCGVVGQFDDVAGEVPIAFIVLREGLTPSRGIEQDVRSWVADRLTGFKQPREIRFLDRIPRTASGKIVRRELRKRL